MKERNRALERFKREPTEGNLKAYHIAKAKARTDIRHSKKTSWRNCVSKMNSQTSVNLYGIGSIKIKGKESINIIHHLIVNDRDVTSHRDIANACVDNSAFNRDTFTSVRKTAEKQTIKFSSDNSEVYNRPFSIKQPWKS